MKYSTGLRTGMMGTVGLKTALNLGFLRIFSGPAPIHADDAESGTLLAIISNNSTVTGLTMAAAASGAITKTLAEVWSGLGLASGIPSYFRLVAPSDTGVLSTSQVRIQGDVSLLDEELSTDVLKIVAGATQTISSFTLTMPG